MFRQGLLSIALLAGAFTASAQDASWQERFENALELEKNETSLAIFKDLERTATTEYNRSSALYSIGVNYSYLGQHGQSRLFLEKARETYLGQKVRDDYLYNIIAKDLVHNYVKFGMQSKAENLAEERRLTLMPTDPDFWSLDGDDPIHRRSGAACPLVAGNFLREEMVDFNPMGDDFVCKYALQTDEYNLISIYMTRYDEAYSSKVAHTENLKLVNSTVEKLGGSYSEKSKKLRGAFHGEPVHMSRYSYENNSGATIQSGLWTAVTGNWVFKSRVTWDSSLGQDFGQEATQKIINSTTQKVKNHIQNCDDFDTTDFPKLKSELDLNDLTSSSMLALLSISLSRQTEEEVKDEDLEITLFDDSFKRPPTECLEHYTSREGNLMVSSHSGSNRIYTLSGKAPSVDTFLSKPYGMGTGSYMLQSVEKLEDNKTYRHKIYKLYETVPSAEQVFADYAYVFNGEVSAFGHVDISESGDSDINIYTIGAE